MEIICVLIVPIIFFGDLWLKNRVEKGLFVRENKKLPPLHLIHHQCL